MAQLYDPVETWIRTVQTEHTKSASTEVKYRRHLSMFCAFAQTSPGEMLKEYEAMDEKRFKHKFSQLMKAWLASFPSNYAQGTSVDKLVAVKSFFKYNDLPLSHLPSRIKVTYHNRAMELEEIQKVIAQADPRERAFFAFMIQSGLRPDTLCKLKVKDLEPLDMIPCRVMVSEENTKGEYSSYFSFIGEDAISYLKTYWNTRGKVGLDSYVFAAKDGETQLNRGVPSQKFKNITRRLRKTKALDFEQRKRSPIRLYNLRKYFRDNAGHAGADFANFWMGHTLDQSADKHYFPGKGTDITSEVIERHRIVYAEKAMPYLRLEKVTPSETEKIMEQQAREIEDLKAQLASQAAEKTDLLKRILEEQEHMTQIEKWKKDVEKQLQELKKQRDDQS
jgi:integrase